jgi:hypothetical protein
MGSVVDTTMEDGMDMVAFTIEDVGAEIVAPVTLVIISLITGETIASKTLEVVDGFDPILLLFPY